MLEPLRSGPLGSAVLAGSELVAAQETCRRIGARVPDDPHKAWDQATILGRIEEVAGRDARILDVGCAYNRLLRNLADLGYRDLWGVDLQRWPPGDLAHPAVTYLQGDLLAAPFPDASFDVVTALSVLEHGCPSGRFVAEMGRILKPGGHLLVTTDYWRWGKLSGLVPRGRTFGLPWTVQTPARLRELRSVAAAAGLVPTREWDFATDEAPVRWNGRSYTFFAFELVKR